MACGTPVIGLRRGSVPEIVEDGVTGYVCDDVEEMVDAVGRLHEISRHACRRDVEERFNADALVMNYERCYSSLLNAGQ